MTGQICGQREGLGGDLVCQAMSGMLGLYGYREGCPARFGPEQASELAGLAAALGALIARRSARIGGGGDVVDIAIERVATLVTFQMQNASLYHQFGFERGRTPRGDGLPNGLYEAADGYVAFNPWRDPEAIALVGELSGEDAPAVVAELRALRADLTHDQFMADERPTRLIARWVGTQTRGVLVDAVQSRGLLALPVHDAADLLRDPFLEARAFFVDIDHPELATVPRDAGLPMRFGVTPGGVGGRPPRLGEHNAEVYGAIGLDGAALAGLRAEGVL